MVRKLLLGLAVLAGLAILATSLSSRKAASQTSWNPAPSQSLVDEGRRLQAAGKFEEAIRSYQQVLALAKPESKQEVDRFHDACQAAVWGIAESAFAGGDLALALEFYRRAHREFPRPHVGCGLGRLELQHGEAVFEGVLLERLGRYDESVRAYLRAMQIQACGHSQDQMAIHVVDLYEHAGQLADLKAVLDQLDEEYIREYEEKYEKYELKLTQEFRSNVRQRPLRRVLSVRTLEKEKDWNALVRIVAEEKGPVDATARLVQTEEACRVLARNSRQAVPLLKEKLRSGCAGEGWVVYALGLSGTPESVSLLEAEVTRRCVPGGRSGIGQAVRLMGSRRETAALAALEAAATGELRKMVEDVRRQELWRVWSYTEFPPIAGTFQLPRKL